MRENIKIGSLFGVELGLHFGWLLALPLIVFFLGTNFRSLHRSWSGDGLWGVAFLIAVLFFAALILHELAHALVAKRQGLPLDRITLFLLGGSTQGEKAPAYAKAEFLVAVAGPLTSLVLGIVLLFAAAGLGWIRWTAPAGHGLTILVWLGYLNVALAGFSLVPGFPLDGARLLHAIAWWINRDAPRSTRITMLTGRVVGVLFITFGFAAVLSEHILSGICVALIGWFLLRAGSAEYFQVRASIPPLHVAVHDLMSSDYHSTRSDLSVQSVADELAQQRGEPCFLVNDGHRLVGLVTPAELQAVDPFRWSRAKVGYVMLPVSRARPVSPEMPALEALQIMAREDVTQLPVLLNGNVQGVISRGALLRVLPAQVDVSPPSAQRAA